MADTTKDHIIVHMLIKHGDKVALLRDKRGKKRNRFPYAELHMARSDFLVAGEITPFGPDLSYGFIWLGGGSTDQYVILLDTCPDKTEAALVEAYPNDDILWARDTDMEKDPAHMMVTLWQCHKSVTSAPGWAGRDLRLTSK